MQVVQNTGEKQPESRSFLTRHKTLAALLSVIIVALGVGIGAYLVAHRDGGSQSSTRFRMAPDFTLQDHAGKTHRLSDFRGKVVLLHFWASWCPPCLGEIPHWIDLAEDLKGKPVQLLAVSLDTSWDGADKILPSDHLPAGMVSVIDTQSKTSDQFGTYAFPETYLINPKGEILTKWIGPQDWKNPEFLKLIDTLVAQIH